MKRSITSALIFCLCWQYAAAQSDSLKALSGLSLEELLNVRVVSASGFLQKTTEAPSTIQVITAEQIKDRGYIQLSDALRDVPGIDLIHINGYAPTLIYFRGMYGAENLRALLMIDGVAENSIIGSNDLAGPAYSLHNIERIEIISGPASALYGANAFGGVINLITKKAADINSFYAAKGFGSFGTSTAELLFGIQGSKLEFSISGSLYDSEGPAFRNRDPEYAASFVKNAHSINTRLTYNGDYSKTTLGLRMYHTPMGWGTYSNSPTAYLRLPSQGNENTGTVGILTRPIRGEEPGIEISYKRALYLENQYARSTKFNLLSRLIFREAGVDEDSYLYAATSPTQLIRAPVASHSSRAAAEIVASYAPTETHRLSFGADFYRDNVEKGAREITLDLNTVYLLDGRDTLYNLNSTFKPRRYDIRSNFGAFGQYVLSTSMLGSTTLTLGGRFDHNSYFGNFFSPRLALVNQTTEALTLKLIFGRAFRAPTNLEIYQAPPNVKLKTEKINSYEVNAIYKFSRNFGVQVSGFRNELSDVIFISNLANFVINKNPGEIKVNGLEARLDLAYSTRLSGFLNFTLQNARVRNTITNAQRNMPGVAKAKANAGFSWDADDLITFSLSGNWVGKRETPSTSPYGDVAGYILANLNVSTRRLFSDRISASLTVQNLFDTKWLDPGFRTADGLLYSTVLEQPGRFGLLKVSINIQ